MENQITAEIDWMFRFQAGEDGAFDRLVETYHRRMFAFVYRMLQNAHESEDACQEVFLQVFKSRQAYRAQAGLTAWMYTIARRVCLNRIRFRKRHPTAYLEDDADEPRVAAHSKLARGAPDTLEDLVKQEQALAVRTALADLPENERQALIMDHWEGLSHEEIGRVLGDKSVSAVKSLVFRARRHLREALEATRPPAPEGEVSGS